LWSLLDGTKSKRVSSNAGATQQFKRLAQQSAISAFERHVAANKYPNGSSIEVAWLRNGVDA
jgi:hypothetical protein